MKTRKTGPRWSYIVDRAIRIAEVYAKIVGCGVHKERAKRHKTARSGQKCAFWVAHAIVGSARTVTNCMWAAPPRSGFCAVAAFSC